VESDLEYESTKTGDRPGHPMFSVIMPAYNSQDYVAEAIESVLAQDLPHWELLIVDDGSTDDTLAIATLYAKEDERIRVFTQGNAGTAAARNRALEHATAPWALMLDSDDMILPHCMSTYARFIDAHPGHAVYSCNGRMLYPSGRTVKVYRGRRGNRSWSAELTDVLSASTIMLPGAVVDLAALLSAGGFVAGVYNEDHDLWIRLLAAGKSHLCCPEPLVTYRQVATSKTKRWARTAASSLEVVRSLGAERTSELGIHREWLLGVRAWESATVVGEAQEMVLAGNRGAAIRRVWRGCRSVIWTPRNVVRFAAIVFVFPLYRTWLGRSR